MFISGIVKKKKKDRVVWDEVVKQWVPQYGFKKKIVEDQKNYDGRVVDDDNSDEEEGNDKVVSLSDINNERSDSNFSCGGISSIPNRGVSRQVSAKSFRRSVQDTLKHDEDS